MAGLGRGADVNGSATKMRDQASRLAASDLAAAQEIAFAIKEPWFRCQAIAAVARHAQTRDVQRFADAAFAAASACADDYKRSAVAAWPIRALVERGFTDQAMEALRRARLAAKKTTPASSSAEALFGLLQAGWDLGSSPRREIVEDLMELHARDTFWRIERAVVDALCMLGAVERELAESIAQRITDAKCRAKALARIQAPFPVRPRDYF